MTMTQLLLVSAIASALSPAACNDHSCGDVPKFYPATGSGAVMTGELAPGALDQRIVVSSDRTFLEYTFTRNGTTTTARYALSETPRTVPWYFVTIRRTPPHGDCAAQAGRGPVVDSVEVSRGGVVISDARAFYAAANCGQMITAKAPVELNGPPDGLGLALAGDPFGWAVGERLVLESGDAVTVTVLDGAGEAFDVYAARQQVSFDMKLGTLTGTGTLTVP
jgi:hypothetical protein